MLKRFVLLSLGIMAIGGASGAPLTPQEALSRAQKESGSKIKGLERGGMKYVTSFNGEEEEPLAYAFENPNGKGFLIVSGDDIAYPVLGYSDSGNFDPDNMPVQMKDWLKGYCDEIEYAKKVGVTSQKGNAPFQTRADKAAIAPMIKTKWDQGEPYFNDCPKINGRNCYTGCVATSMAQVMNYFKYPEVGQGASSVTVNGQQYRMNFADKPFDWDNMLDNYLRGTYNETQASAVAYLMEACGFSVKMGYGLSASGAASQMISYALKNYFKYDPSTTFEARISYSGSEWDDKIYNSLKEGSPVIYNGNDLNIGHSFICDGYDGNGYYHINWGWSGMSDGYFLLNALNPEALGTGGGDGGGFNFLQGAVLNIKKPTGLPAAEEHPTLTVYGLIGADSVTKDALGNSILTVSLKHGYGPFSGWRNETDQNLMLNIGGIFVDSASDKTVDSIQGKFGGMNNITLSSGAYYQGTVKATFTIPANLPDGDYKVIIAARDAGHPEYAWVPVAVPYAYPDYILLKKTNGVVTASSVEPSKLSISDFKIVGNLFYGRYCNVTFNVINDSDYELTEAISIVLTDNKDVKFKSANILVTAPAHSTLPQEWTLLLYPESGQGAVTQDKTFGLSVVNDFTGESYGNYGEVIMQPNPGDPSVSLRSMTIVGATTEETEICGDKFNVLVVEDKNDFTVDMTIRLSRGYFDSNVYVDIAELAPNATTPNQTVPVKDQVFMQHLEMNTGDQETLTMPISFPEGEVGKIYYVNAKYYGPRSEKMIGSLRFKLAGDSGIEDVISIDDENVEYYNLQGLRIAYPAPGETVILKKGNSTRKMILK